MSKDAIENELLKRELNTASARITSLERELSTYKEKCSILTERISYFEDRHTKNLYDQYFPTDRTPSGPAPARPVPECSTAWEPSPVPPTSSSEESRSPNSQPVTLESDSQPMNPERETILGSESLPSSDPYSVSPPRPSVQQPSGPYSVLPPRPGVQEPTEHCQCLSEISMLKQQISAINQQIGSLSCISSANTVPPCSEVTTQPTCPPPPSSCPGYTWSSKADAGVQTRPSESRRDQRMRSERSTRRQDLPARATPPWRTPVWLPGLTPPTQRSYVSWPPKSGRNVPSSSGRGHPSHSPHINLIDLN